jgi:hypothetical protein
MKKNLLLLLCFLSICAFSQEPIEAEEQCGTAVPTQQWDEWFNKEVEKYKANLQTGKAKMINYTIPVVVHVIHYNNPVGTYPNISQAQVVSQINAMNADFAGVGYNYTNCPAPFTGLIANTGIQFCLALTDPLGQTLAEPGINRIDAQANGWINPNTLNTTAAIQNFVNNTVKPASIWDPTRYFNIWICTKATDSGLLGYATFPAGTSLTGIPGGLTGTATSDGVWCYSKIFGQLNGTLWASFNKGKVMSHEVGHWLGLRHMWGDGNCLTDFCNDTPWHKAPTASSGPCKTFPYLVNECGPGQSPNGRMFMNFMDYSDDDCMYMFTPDQTARMQTAMSQCPFRNQLGTHGLCNTSPPIPSPAESVFELKANPCIGIPFTPSNTSTGGPSPTFTWMSIPSASFNPNPYVAAPAITFMNPGAYTLILTASNPGATSTSSISVFPQSNCPKPPVCLDTLSALTEMDTLTTHIAPTNSFVAACTNGYTGFLTGTNCYQDREFAQYFPGSTYSNTPLPQVNSMIVLFDQRGTKATATTSATQIYFKIYGGTGSSGPGSLLGQKGDSLGVIEATTPTNQVQYCGNPNYIFPSPWVIPHIVDFPQPVIIPTSGFFGCVQSPYPSIQDSIQIFASTLYNPANDSTAWVLLNNLNNWRTFKHHRKAKIQLAILPQITCRPVVGIDERSSLNSSINLMPNPNAGIFSIIFTLPRNQKISMKILNYLGQEISTDHFENVSKNVFDVDLSSRPDGIYFIEISNGIEKTTKKLIIAH